MYFRILSYDLSLKQIYNSINKQKYFLSNLTVAFLQVLILTGFQSTSLFICWMVRVCVAIDLMLICILYKFTIELVPISSTVIPLYTNNMNSTEVVKHHSMSLEEEGYRIAYLKHMLKKKKTDKDDDPDTLITCNTDYWMHLLLFWMYCCLQWESSFLIYINYASYYSRKYIQSSVNLAENLYFVIEFWIDYIVFVLQWRKNTFQKRKLKPSVDMLRLSTVHEHERCSRKTNVLT